MNLQDLKLFSRRPFSNFLHHFLIFSIIVSCNDKTSDGTVIERRETPEESNQVDVLVLQKAEFNAEILCNGKIRALQKIDIKSKVNGEISKVFIKNGYRVANGDQVISIDNREYKLQFDKAEIAVKATSLEAEDQLLYRRDIMKENDSKSAKVLQTIELQSGYTNALQDLEYAKYNLDNTKIYAPFQGKVANMKHRMFDHVTQGETICTIINDAQFEVEFYLMEEEVSDISITDKVEISPFSKNSFHVGHISEINPIIDENGLTLVKALVQNNGELIEGMNVKVIVKKSIKDRFVVPKTAVVQRDDQKVIFKYKNGRAIWTFVSIEMENSNSYSITPDLSKSSVLAIGDSIIYSGNLNLSHDSFAQIK